MDMSTTDLGHHIAYRASGSQKILFEMLREAGATIIRKYPAPAFEFSQDAYRRKLLQVHVVFPDGTIGFFSPGGPAKIWSYRFVEGHTDEDLELAKRLTTNETIVLDPDLEEMCARYTAAQQSRNPIAHDEGMAEAVLGDPVYGRRVSMPKWNMDVTMLQEPKVAIRYWHRFGIPTSKEAHRQRAEYFRDLARRFDDEWQDVVEQARKLYGNGSGSLISGVYRDHFPEDVKDRLRFLAQGGQMLKDATRLHEYLSKTRSPAFH